MSGSLGEWLRDNEDEVLYRTGTVTEAEIQAFKQRISNGMTTAEDVVLLERLLCRDHKS